MRARHGVSLGAVATLLAGCGAGASEQEVGTESDEDQRVGEHALADSPAPARWRGIGRRLYENSLLIAMGSI